MKRAVWTVTVRRRSVDDDGVLHIEAEAADRGQKQADLLLTVTPDRALRVEVVNTPDSEGFSGFEAWMVGGPEPVGVVQGG